MHALFVGVGYTIANGLIGRERGPRRADGAEVKLVGSEPEAVEPPKVNFGTL